MQARKRIVNKFEDEDINDMLMNVYKSRKKAARRYWYHIHTSNETFTYEYSGTPKKNSKRSEKWLYPIKDIYD